LQAGRSPAHCASSFILPGLSSAGRRRPALARTILIVDDDAALCRLYEECLGAAGYRVLVQPDAAGALPVLAAERVDLLVLDVVLPGTGGFEFAAQLRRDGPAPGIPILFVSGLCKASRHRTDAVEQLGAVDFLEKPLAAEDLLEHVHQTIGSAEGDDTAVSAARPSREAAQGPFVHSRGDLATVPFALVYADLARRGASALVHVRRERVRKIVRVDAGRVGAVTSNLLSECLGRVLVQAGMIAADDCEASLVELRRTGRRQGETLVAAERLTARDLAYGLQLQLEQKLFDVFSWDSGDYRIAEAAEPPGDAPLDMPPARVVYEGLVRSGDEDRAWRLLAADARLVGGPEDSSALRTLAVRTHPEASQAIADMGLDPPVEALAPSLDGSTPLSELLTARAVPALEALALVATLRCLRLAELTAPDEFPAGLRRISELETGEQPRIRMDAPLRAAADIDAIADAAVLRPLSARDRAAWERLSARLQDLRRASHYEVLGVERTAGTDRVRHAFAALAREYDPDRRHPGGPAPVRALSMRVLDRLREACDVLADPDRRADYDASQPVDRVDSDAQCAERILRADEAFRAASERLAAGSPAEAAALLHEAVELHPDEPEFRVWFAWALWRANPDVPESATRALAHVGTALAMSPRLPSAHVVAAAIHAAVGDAASARRENAFAVAAGAPPPGALPPDLSGAAP